PETRRLDLVVRVGSELIVVDHKTRSSKISEHRRLDYARNMCTRPAVLGQSWLAWQHWKTPEPPPVMYNMIIKPNARAKTRKFGHDRLIARPTAEQINRWLDVRKAEAAEQARQSTLANWDACAPEIGNRC